MGIVGTPTAARRQLEQVTKASVIDTPVVALPPTAGQDLATSTIEALAPTPP